MFRKLLIILLLVLFAGTAAADPQVVAPNPGFEEADGDGQPLQWQSGAVPGGTNAALMVDSQTAHSQKNSLLLNHEDWNSSAALSAPLTLKVGRLYKLGAWIKTQGVCTDPAKRYPTPVGACLTMESFPFTNHSPALGGTGDWKKVETLFIATRSRDRIALRLGHNGPARGKTWFDDVTLEEAEDIAAYIPPATVKWHGPAYRYDDRGWIFLHIEGKPYERGFQLGALVSQEITAYLSKLAYDANNANPGEGWGVWRKMADIVLLRKYDPEFLEEMKGVADGAAKAGAKFQGKEISFLDIVALNSFIDLDQMMDAVENTPHPLTGRGFLNNGEELNVPMKQHKCSGFLANGPATVNGDIVFGQIFMWSGYTGVHWNIICDVQPDKGRRFVFQTFPGGIHSGADFYINDAGIVIGETTVAQTPYNPAGTPQSNRIRRAIQYSGSIDEVVKTLSAQNNGMYTNDWLIADTKANETAIFLLGTHKSKLWRSGLKQFPGDTPGFLWSNNNNKDMEVRKEYIANPDNAPHDVVFSPWNRDIAFNQFYQTFKGKIDAIAGVNLWASSPINMPHACDGKITTSEMAKQLVFLAHSGKLTLREKFPAPNYRLMPDRPGAVPHLSLGYSVPSPLFVTEKLKELKKQQESQTPGSAEPGKRENDWSGLKAFLTYDEKNLWHNTVFPASEKENWFVSASAAYWQLLSGLPAAPDKGMTHLTNALGYGMTQMLFTVAREGSVAPVNARTVYDRYKDYRVTRVRGTFVLHQLRLKLGNETFGKIMNAIHATFREKPMTNRQFMDTVNSISGLKLDTFIGQWLDREDLPQPEISATATASGDKWDVTLKIRQPEKTFYRFLTSVVIETAKNRIWKMTETDKPETEIHFSLDEKPLSLEFNPGWDIPVSSDNFYTFGVFYNEFNEGLVVYGTARQTDANHTLGIRFSEALADRWSEMLPPVVKDGEATPDELKNRHLFVLGGVEDNTLSQELTQKLGISAGKNHFTWRGKEYGAADDGLMVVYPNPANPARMVVLALANSAMQLYNMTKKVPQISSWAVFKGDQAVEDGFHPIDRFKMEFSQGQ